MKRGDIWTAAGGPGYAGKPRPVLILQDDAFSGTDSVLVALFTTDPTVAPLLRLPVAPDAANGLAQPCALMIEKIIAVPRAKLHQFIGRLDAARMAQVNMLVATVLGLARAPGGSGATAGR